MSDPNPPSDLTPDIARSAAEPKSARGDSGSMEQHSLPDQIAADRYAKAQGSTKRGRGLGIRRIKQVPPGTSGIDRFC